VKLGVSRAGLTGAAVYVCLAGLWLALADPAGTPEIYAIWFGALAVVELMIPGIANQVTLGRAYLAAPALAYSYQSSTLGLLAVTVALAGLSDLVDGTVARRFDGPTQFGGALDPIVDGIYFGGVALGLAAGHAYPRWLAAVVIVRYGLPAAVGGLLLALGRSLQLRHTLLGQVSTAVNAILLGGIALLRGLGQDASALVAVAEVVIPLAALATFAHLFWANRASVAGGDG
jgi:cardiolipin synthase (CMP-forming)